MIDNKKEAGNSASASFPLQSDQSQSNGSAVWVATVMIGIIVLLVAVEMLRSRG